MENYFFQSNENLIILTIIYMESILNFDWLKEMSFPGNTVEIKNSGAKRGNEHARKSQMTNQMQVLIHVRFFSLLSFHFEHNGLVPFFSSLKKITRACLYQP